ncbi:Uncharacterised protein [Janthinobacterium lividum]|nr:Uncharacterised protein [Janthinobacterium lividum]
MNIEQARFNMIEQQIRPWDVLDIDVLELLNVVKREDFVPAAYKTWPLSIPKFHWAAANACSRRSWKRAFCKT